MCSFLIFFRYPFFVVCFVCFCLFRINKRDPNNTASTSGYFRCFSAESDDFRASFLQEPAGSSGRNLRLGLLRDQYRNDNTNENDRSELLQAPIRSEPLQAPIRSELSRAPILSKLLQAPIRSELLQTPIRSELSPKKSESNEDHAGDMESELDTQAQSMMMIQSGGSMANSGMKRKSIQRANESLGLRKSQKKSNKSIPIQQQKSKNNDDDDDNNEELGEEVRA